MDLGEKIYRLRVQKNLSQIELANTLNVSRQSISKWETNASVPELDKLIKLSEIFEISLDELVLNRHPVCSTPETVSSTTAETPVKSSQKTAGTILLVSAAIVWLAISFLGGILEGLVFASPFIACGLICLFVKKHPGLWCLWAIYSFLDLYFRFTTGVHWQFALLPIAYQSQWLTQLLIAWVWLIYFAILTLITVCRLQKSNALPLRKNITYAVLAWLIYFFLGLIISLSTGTVIEHTQIILHNTISSISGWIRELILVSAFAFTIPGIHTLLRQTASKHKI